MNQMPVDHDVDQDFEALLRRLIQLAAQHEDMPSEDTPIGRLTRELFANNWASCRDGLLERTSKIRVQPEFSPAPHRFRFEIDCPFKRKLGAAAPVELMPGSVRGQIIYRGDLLVNHDGPTVAVLIDRELGFFHPNVCPQRGVVCLGDESQLAAGPIPLDQLLSSQLYAVVSYQNRRPSHPLNLEAARYFALELDAMEGLTPVQPLY